MSNFITSLIRTWVPIAVGALVSWLLTLGIEIDADAQAGLIIFLTSVLQGLYYLVVRVLEQRWPRIGALLLGNSSKPDYNSFW